MPSNHLILCRPLLLLPSLFPSIRVFSNESVLCIRWPKCQSFSFNISPSNEYSERIFFRMDWFDLLAVQGTLKSLIQHHSSKASILRCSGFFIVQLSHPYMTTGKTIALTRWTFVSINEAYLTHIFPKENIIIFLYLGILDSTSVLPLRVILNKIINEKHKNVKNLALNGPQKGHWLTVWELQEGRTLPHSVVARNVSTEWFKFWLLFILSQMICKVTMSIDLRVQVNFSE